MRTFEGGDFFEEYGSPSLHLFFTNAASMNVTFPFQEIVSLTNIKVNNIFHITAVSNQFVSCSKGITIFMNGDLNTRIWFHISSSFAQELTSIPNGIPELMLSEFLELWISLEDTVCVDNLSCYKWVASAMMPEEE